MTFGISALLLAAIPVYLIVGWSLPEARRSRLAGITQAGEKAVG